MKARYSTPLLAAALLGLCTGLPIQAQTVAVSADAQLNEQTPDTASGTGAAINARTSPAGDRNEIIALRFDLTGHDLTKLRSVRLNLVNYRDNSARSLSLYVVNPGTTGATTWDDATVTFNTMPGLLASDGNCLTQSIDATATTLLSNLAMSNLAKGTTETFGDPAITTFLNGVTGGPVFTFLVAFSSDYTNSGQARFASREAAALDAGTPSGAAGDYAATLTFTVDSGGDPDPDPDPDPEPDPSPNAWETTLAANFGGTDASDLLFSNTADGAVVLWIRNGDSLIGSTTIARPGLEWKVERTPDFNGDGHADLLWRNTTTGQHVIWLVEGLRVLGSAVVTGASTDWVAAATGDYNGDGKADLLWRNTATGEAAIWAMNGTGIAQAVAVLGAGSGWEPLDGAVNLDGNACDDILWSHPASGSAAAWLMDASLGATGASLLTGPSTWSPVPRACGDFDNDGRSDLVWWNSDTGETAVWLMNGGAVTTAAMLTSGDPAWKPLLAADFDGGGSDDILWRNSGSGDIHIYLMNGTAVASNATIYDAGTGWEVIGTLNYNKDGRADLLWRATAGGGAYNVRSGAIWVMNGLAVTSGSDAVAASDVRPVWSGQADGFASLDGTTPGQILAGGTTGGAGGTVVTVTNQTDLAAYANATGAFTIRVSGSIVVSPFGTEITVGSNKTIIGVGDSAEIVGGGFRIINQSNVIIRNLTIRDSYIEGDWEGKTYDYDGIQMDSSHHIWIDHVRFSRLYDGMIDSRLDTNSVTVSWCILEEHNKAFGIGWTDNVVAHMTIHHVWLRDTNQRNPSADNLECAHLYNNFMQDLTSYGNYSRGATAMVIENSYFQNVLNPHYPDATATLVASGNIYVNCSGRQETLGTAFNPAGYYSYTLDATADVPDLLMIHAGPQAAIGQ